MSPAHGSPRALRLQGKAPLPIPLEVMVDFWLSLGVKMATSAVLVVGASKVIERAGPFLGAMIATLPLSAGPAYAFLAYDHGPAFLARSALAGLPTTACIALFILVYARVAQHAGAALSIAAGLGAWGAAAAAMRLVPWNGASGLALCIVAFLVVMRLTRRWRTGAVLPRAPAKAWDLPARAGAVMTTVALVVTAGHLLGPEVAGLLAQAPVVMTSLAVVLHPRVGGRVTAEVMVLALPGMVGFSIGLATVELTAVPLGSAAALSLGLAVCIVWNLGLIALAKRRTVPATSPQNRLP